LGWAGLGQSADGLGWIGSQKWTYEQLWYTVVTVIVLLVIYRVRKCADTIGTVPVHRAGHFQC